MKIEAQSELKGVPRTARQIAASQWPWQLTLTIDVTGDDKMDFGSDTTLVATLRDGITRAAMQALVAEGIAPESAIEAARTETDMKDIINDRLMLRW